jgi:multisubunit Na+/H+ antiporter MnhB subunit
MRLLFTVVMLGSIYLLFVGHNQPGGGFAGGIVAGAAVALRYISGGIAEVRSLSRGRPWYVLGGGLLLAVVTALTPLLFGESVLESASWTLHPPLLGTVKLSSVLVFDAGVYLVVAGLVMMMFESFGDDPPPVEMGELEVSTEPLQGSAA